MPRQFDSTHWTLVLAAGNRESPDAEAALSTLCATYWHPVYAFVRRSGHDEDAARDLTQEFFTRLLEKNYVGDAKRERGRFRTFLLTAVKHFLANERDREGAMKRGGGVVHIPLEMDDGERSYKIEPVDDVTPDRLFERRWALAVLNEATDRVRQRYQEPDKRRLFDHLKPLLTGERADSYAQLAATLNATEGSLRVTVHRMRRQFTTALRNTVAETLDDTENVDEELTQLLEAVGR